MWGLTFFSWVSYKACTLGYVSWEKNIYIFLSFFYAYNFCKEQLLIVQYNWKCWAIAERQLQMVIPNQMQTQVVIISTAYMNKNIQNDHQQSFECWKHFICSGNKSNRKQNPSIKPTSKFPVEQQIHKMCFSIRCWEWKYLETSWWQLATIMCLNCYLIFVSHADLA